ncbi:MAG: ZIP family metal transporter [Flavobacteriales bacterium]|nr:ZIP family metal transporter [Flavobacteriales bacterium]
MTATIALLFLVVPLMAGFVVRTWRPGPHWSRSLLSFGGAFLLGVTVMHMLPELYAEGGAVIGMWLLGGFLLQVLLEFFSQGIEHGHQHLLPGKTLPLVTLIGLCVHAFVEAVPFAAPTIAMDIPFVLGVLLHKVPMALALAAVMDRSGVAPRRAWTYLLLFAVSAPVGIAVGSAMGRSAAPEVLFYALALAIGMLLHISTTIIFESAPEHRFHRQRFVAVLVGIGLAFLAVH